VQPAVTIFENCSRAFALLCAASACSLAHAQVPTPPSAQTRPAAESPTPPAAFREVTDEIGRTIRIPLTLHRIVSLSPNLTETLYALGLQDLLVGDTDYCDYPPDAQRKPKVGAVINPSLEAIAALRPDLVLVTKLSNRLETVTALAGLGIPSYATTDPHSVDQIISSTQRLADLLGASDSGSVLVKGLQQRLADTSRRVAPFPRSHVLFVVWTQPLISIGKDTFIADALRYAGADSIVDSPQSWPQLNLEEVARLQPEFLVFADDHVQTQPLGAEALAQLPGWRILDAVRNHRYAKTSSAIDRPAPRLISAIEDLARQFHPDAFSALPEPAPIQPRKPTPDTTPPPAPDPQPPSHALRTCASSHLHSSQELACAR
jgi:iron complex transport system substrate-binding protein